MIQTENFEKVTVTSIEELKNWLHKNHLQKESVWLVTYKKIVPEYIQPRKYWTSCYVMAGLMGYEEN